jgi:hypothetical protein
MNMVCSVLYSSSGPSSTNLRLRSILCQPPLKLSTLRQKHRHENKESYLSQCTLSCGAEAECNRAVTEAKPSIENAPGGSKG